MTSNASVCDCPDECNMVRYSNEISSGTYPNPTTVFPSSILRRRKFRDLVTDDAAAFNRYAEYYYINDLELRWKSVHVFASSVRDRTNLIKLNVYLKSISGMSYIMDQRTTWADFICRPYLVHKWAAISLIVLMNFAAATGGLFGLGFGFSILSAAELFYFLTVRWCYHAHRAGKEKVAIKPGVFRGSLMRRRTHRNNRFNQVE